MAYYGDSFTFLYRDDVRTRKETHLWTSTACYRDSFIFYMQIIFIPHRKHLWNFSACYRDSFNVYIQMMVISHRKHLWTSMPVTEIALLFTCRWCSYLTGNIYGYPLPVTGIALLFICRWCSYPTGNTYGTSVPLTGIALMFEEWCLLGCSALYTSNLTALMIIFRWCSYLTGNIYGPPCLLQR
jgi:hypothetical protein